MTMTMANRSLRCACSAERSACWIKGVAKVRAAKDVSFDCPAHSGRDGWSETRSPNSPVRENAKGLRLFDANLFESSQPREGQRGREAERKDAKKNKNIKKSKEKGIRKKKKTKRQKESQN